MAKIKRVIIAEDVESIHHGLATVLNQMKISRHTFVQYCDDAYLQIKKAQHENNAFDLLITDLSFAKDHRDVNLSDGESLIKKLRAEKNPIKILVFSIESKPQKIKKFFKLLAIDAYVCKGRNDQADLIEALKKIQLDEKFYSEAIGNIDHKNTQFEINNYDIKLLKMLEEGYHQSEISKAFKQLNLSPSSTSAIEKRINSLKNYFKAKNTTNLVAKAKDLGVI